MEEDSGSRLKEICAGMPRHSVGRQLWPEIERRISKSDVPLFKYAALTLASCGVAGLLMTESVKSLEAGREPWLVAHMRQTLAVFHEPGLDGAIR